MGILSLSSSPVPVGLDIGTDHVRAAQIKSTSGGLTLSSYGTVDMPMGAVVEGEIVDIDAVSSSIKEAWRRSGAKGVV